MHARMKNARIGTAAILILLLLACAAGSDLLKLSGDYLGQPVPGSSPVLFAPGVVSTGLFERDMAMTPDGGEIFFTVVAGRYAGAAVFVTRRDHGRWTRPEVAEFSGNGRWKDLEPFVSPDGRRLFFVSDRPNPAVGDTAAGNPDIWVLDRNESGWSAPQNLGPPVNTADEEYFPSVTAGGALYFTRQAKGNPLSQIFRSRLENGRYAEPVRLPDRVNFGRSRYNAFVASDESFLIIPVFGAEGGMGGSDYFVVFRSPDDKWSLPVNLGPRVNSAADLEYSPYVSPDGRYFFFMSARGVPSPPARWNAEEMRRRHAEPGNGNPDIFWMSAAFLDSLRATADFR